MATPKDKANHTSTKRVRWRSCLKACMAEIVISAWFSRSWGGVCP
jgi:hypothetical protein